MTAPGRARQGDHAEHFNMKLHSDDLLDCPLLLENL